MDTFNSDSDEKLVTKVGLMLDDLFLHFGRKLTSTTRLVWMQYLTARLSHLEIVQAIAKVLIEDQFLPSAEQLVFKIKGDIKDRALQSWLKVFKLSERYQITSHVYPYLQDDLISFYCLQQVGGVSKIASASSLERKDIKQDYIKNYIFTSRSNLTDDSISQLINWDFQSVPASSALDSEIIFDPISPEQWDLVRSKISKLFSKN